MHKWGQSGGAKKVKIDLTEIMAVVSNFWLEIGFFPIWLNFT
jgi:hypothetical protein